MADTYRETEEWLERCKQNHGSKYNSGWDDLHWEKEIKKAETTQTIKEIQDVVDVLSGWDIETVEEFKETRLDPFNKSLKHRVKPKTIEEVKGALLNNRVKNPLLC